MAARPQITNPKGAQAQGLGMVYQHFTLVPSLTGAENLVISRADAPAVIAWGQERARLSAFMAGMPFRLNLDRPVAELAAGEKQKLEIVKQLYLEARFLILDEPTSVLTPAEAEEVLGLLRAMTDRGDLTVLMISHKFREVETFARSLSVLRRGKLAGGGAVGELSRDDMAAMMMGERKVRVPAPRVGAPDEAREVLRIEGVTATDASGLRHIAVEALSVRAREIVGIAGVSGNGQKELADVLGGQVRATGGRVVVAGAPYAGTRSESRARRVRFIPEEPLRNACAPRMSVVENLGIPRLRSARRGRDGQADLLARPGGDGPARARPDRAVQGEDRLLGGADRDPVGRQRAAGGARPRTHRSGRPPDRGQSVLRPRLLGRSEIRNRIVAARNAGAAVLLISEDLDEILELSDRIVVMSEGRLVYETPAATAEVATIGRHMAGHH